MSLSGKDTLLRRYNVDNPMLVPAFAKKAGSAHLKTMIAKDGDNWARSLFNEVASKNGGIHPMNATSTSQSRGETEIINCLIDLGVPSSEIIHGDRKTLSGKEIDVYLPRWHIGVELCGEYWHSELINKDRLHVFHKFEIARDLGVHIITVFGREWKERRVQIINLIASKIFDLPKIYARHCTFCEISKREAKEFVNDNQIQPLYRVDSAFALKYRGSIVEVVSLYRNMITRLCPEMGCRVVGGASKLIRESMRYKGFKNVRIRSDNRFSNGDLLKTIGFVEVCKKSPSYFFVDKHGRHFNSRGLRRARVYDCGSVIWSLEQ